MLRIAVAIVLAALFGCRDERPPSYVRLGGSAPAIAEMPATRAQLVVFWAAWCAPCRVETPALRALAKSPPGGLAVVTMSHDPGMDQVTTFLGGPADPDLHLRIDLDKKVGEAFGVRVLPTSFLVVDSRLVARFDGPRAWDDTGTRALLERLIREAGSRPARSED